MIVRKFDNIDECMKEYKRVRPWILKAIEYTPDAKDAYSETDIIERIFERKMYLYTTPNAFAIVHYITDENNEKFCRFALAGGDKNNAFDEIMLALPQVEEWAKSYGFPDLQIDGRKGWTRVMEAYGFVTEDLNKKENHYILRRQKEAPDWTLNVIEKRSKTRD